MREVRTVVACVVVGLGACNPFFAASNPDQVLQVCADPLGRADAELIEPSGQWQDQFVVVRFTHPQTHASLHTTQNIGFAAGRVDGLAWTVDGKLLLVDKQGAPRVVYDVERKDIIENIGYGMPAPTFAMQRLCLAPQPAIESTGP